MAVKAYISKLNHFLNSPAGVVFTGFVAFGMAFYSIFSVIRAFNRLDARTGDVRNTVRNWETRPLMEVQIAPLGSSCPESFEDMTTIVWPGTTAGPCACPLGATHRGDSQESSNAACNGNQTSAGCETDAAISAIELIDWRGGYRICGRRGGESPLRADGDDIIERPLPLPGSPCPAGYFQCGTGTYDTDRAICFRHDTDGDEETCPIRVLEVMTEALFNTQADDWDGSVVMNDTEPALVLAYSRRSETLLPIAEHTVGVGEAPCVGETLARQFEQTRGNIDGNSNVESSCNSALRDRRYASWDVNPQEKLLRRNFLEHPLCSDPDVPFSFPVGCRPGDRICNVTNGRDTCDKLQSYAKGGREVIAFQRGEIFWRSDCPTSRVNLYDHVEPLEEARDLQRILMLINIFSNVFVGVLIPALLIRNALYGDVPCIPGKGEDEKRIIDICKTWLSLFFRLAKFIPLVLVTVLIHEIKDFFEEAASVECSDATTEATVVDALQVVFSVYTIYSFWVGDGDDPLEYRDWTKNAVSEVDTPAASEQEAKEGEQGIEVKPQSESVTV